MNDPGKTRQNLLEEVSRLKERIRELEAVPAGSDPERERPPSFEGSLEDFIELSVEGISIVQNGLLEVINESFAEKLGYSREEMVGRPFTDFLDPGDVDRVLDLYNRHIGGERNFGIIQADLLQKDGSRIFVDINAKVIDYRNKPASFVLVHDLTESIRLRKDLEKAYEHLERRVERRNAQIKNAYEILQEQYQQRVDAEKMLEESRRSLSTLMGNLPGMAYRCKDDVSWTMLFVSEGCFDLTGHPAEELVDNARISYAQLIHPDDREYVWREIRSALEKDQPFRMVYRIVPPDGLVKWVWEQGCLVSDPHSEEGVLEGFITDITDRKRAEQALSYSEERYRTLVDQASDAFFLTDPEGNIAEANTSFCRMLGYSIQELREMNISALVSERDEKTEVSILREFRRRRTVVFDRRFRRKDASVIVVEIGGKRLTNGYLQGIMRDVTLRKRDEEKLRKAAIYDAMTGLFNREHFLERFSTEVRLAQKNGTEFSICLCDLDDFKDVNDRFGHLAGDEVLVALGRIIREEIRLKDIAGRYGGDEFCVIFPNTPASEAILSVERIRSNLAQRVFHAGGKKSFSIHATFGLADLSLDHSDEKALFDSTDKALYQAKAQGGNRSVIFQKG